MISFQLATNFTFSFVWNLETIDCWTTAVGPNRSSIPQLPLVPPCPNLLEAHSIFVGAQVQWATGHSPWPPRIRTREANVLAAHSPHSELWQDEKTEKGLNTLPYVVLSMTGPHLNSSFTHNFFFLPTFLFDTSLIDHSSQVLLVHALFHAFFCPSWLLTGETVFSSSWASQVFKERILASNPGKKKQRLSSGIMLFKVVHRNSSNQTLWI